MKRQKKKKWTKFRHGVIRNIAYVLLYPYMRFKYGARVQKFREKKKRQYLIAFNHQTALDQFLVGMAFKGAVYYVASEDIFTNGLISKLLKWALAPIPIKKQATDVQAVLTCKRVVREGGTIALAPEGNRTYGGRTGYLKPAIVGLVRILKLPLAIFRIEGGYGVHPRWSDKTRKGGMRAYVSRVVEPEEYAQMSDEELLALVEQGLYVDESAIGGEYRHKKLAEYMERAFYYCPDCGLSEWESAGDTIECKRCGAAARYLPDKTFEGVGKPFAFKTPTEWYEAQCAFVNGLDLDGLSDEPLYTENARIFEVFPYKKKTPLDRRGQIRLYKDKIALRINGVDTLLQTDDIEVATVLGRNKLNLYHGGRVYQIKADKRFNALKYVNLCYRYKNIRKGDENGKFLGL